MSIETVQVGASDEVVAALRSTGRGALEEFNKNVGFEVECFLRAGSEPHKFAARIGELTEVPIVVSHVLLGSMLFAYIDLVTPSIKSRFVYTKHYSRMH